MYNFYIYKVTDKKTKEFYIGSQCGGKTIGVNYFTSSRNKDFRNKFKSDPTQFEIKVIGVFADANACVLQENIFIKDNIKNPLCLNRCYRICCELKISNAGIKMSEEQKAKISKANKGKVSHNKGKHLSEEWKNKIRKSNTGKVFSEETRRKIGYASRNRSAETRKKMSDFQRSKTVPVEVRKRISNSMKGIGSKKIICVETCIVYNSATEAAQILGIPRPHISSCVNGKRNVCGGFHWQFI